MLLLYNIKEVKNYKIKLIYGNPRSRGYIIMTGSIITAHRKVRDNGNEILI